MSTRSGRVYNASMSQDQVSGGSMERILQMLMEERQLRDQENARCEAERETAHQLQIKQMQEQMEAMRDWMEHSGAQEQERAGRAKQMQVQLSKLSDSDDIEAYLTTCERMMSVYKVPEDQWVFKLAPQLTGKAQQAYAALGVEEAVDYRRVKEAILRRYDVSEESYRRRFRTTRKSKNETFRELSVRLADLAKKWMAGCDTLEEVLDKLVVEQLLDTMGSDLKIWLSEKKPKSGNEAGSLADDYVQARQRDCVDRGGTKEQTGESRKCHKCGKLGHLARACSEQTSERPNSEKKESPKFEPKKVKCFNCGVMGHISTRCPERGFYCADQLTKPITRVGLVEGRTVSDIVLDTGCSRTMVHNKLVDKSKYLEGEAATIRCVHGDTALYPLAEVVLELDNRPLTVVAAVSETLPTSVVLGTDVPNLRGLLQVNPSSRHTAGVEEYVVQTHSQARQEVAAKMVDDVETTAETFGCEFDEDLFEELKRNKPYLSRSQKRAKRIVHGLVRAQDRPLNKSEVRDIVDTEEIRRTEPNNTGFFERDGLVYRRWVPAKREPLVPLPCISIPFDRGKATAMQTLFPEVIANNKFIAGEVGRSVRD